MSRKLARIMVLTSAILWGTSFPVIRAGLMYISPILFLFLRFSVATIILFSALFVKNTKFDFRKIDSLVVLAGILNALAYTFQFVGQKFTYATNAALMVNTSPIFTAIFAHFILEEKLTKPRAGAIVLTFLGASIVVLGSGQTLEFRIIGDVLCLLAGVSWGLYMVEAKRIREKRHMDELGLLFIWFLFVTLISGVTLPMESPRIEVNTWSLFAIFHTAILCSVIPYILWYKALKSLEATSSANYFMLEIVISALIEAVFLGLILSASLVIGAALVITGVYLVDYFYRTEKRPTQSS